jgi:predicted dehydrogenase
MKLRLGVIGLNDQWEKRYLPALRVLEDRFSLIAIYEPVAQRAASAARELAVVTHDSYRALCRRSDIDAVLVLNPHWFGELPVLAACEYGKAVYLDSRVFLTLEETARIREVVRESGVAFMVEFARRYSPATIRLKELIATVLGSPQMLFCHRRLSQYLKCNGLANGRRQVTMDLDLIELADWCRFIVGRSPVSVMGVSHRASSGEEPDYLMVSLAFGAANGNDSDVIAQLSCGKYLPPHWHEAINYRPSAELQVVCEHGVACVDLPATLVWFDEAGRHQETLEHERPLGERLLFCFHRMVTSLVQRMSDIDDLYLAQKVIESAKLSAQVGQRIHLAGDQ